MTSKRILWYLFHPNLEQSRGNAALAEACRDLPGLTFVDAYAEYAGFKIDVPREQERLRAADLVVFQHPFYWYSSPALFKKWQDDVLEFGFAYPPKEGTALHGKHWLSVLTTGGPDWSYTAGGYNNYTMSELLRPLQQTANLCGMRWRTPFVVHGVLPQPVDGMPTQSPDDLAAKGAELRAYVESIDTAERRSLEPVMPPHYLAASSSPVGAA